MQVLDLENISIPILWKAFIAKLLCARVPDRSPAAIARDRHPNGILAAFSWRNIQIEKTAKERCATTVKV